MGGIDDVIEEMKRDELEGATKLPPIQYAHLRDIYPQKVYGALRNGKLERTTCECGRKVVIVKEADEYFGFATTIPEAEEEVSGSDLDSDDQER